MEDTKDVNAVLKLLVIDDDDIDRMQLKRALASCGFENRLTEHTSLEDIHDLNSLSTFDCIFLDYLLPGDNGLSLVKKLRDSGVKTPVVIITSQGNESIAVELMKAGASDYIVKNDINGPSLGKVLRNMLSILRAVQERELAQQALRISESRLAEAQRIARIGNWEYSAGTHSFYCSKEVYNILGVAEHFVVTVESFLSFVSADDRERVRAKWNQVLIGEQLNVDFRIVSSQGIKFVNSQAYAVYRADGQLEKIVGTLQDITERKLAEEEISRSRELAENSIKVREVFLANMSHEIRTPMNAILGFTDLLYQTALDDEQKEFVDSIHFSGENLLVIINDILDLSKIRSGKLTIEKCAFNLSDLTSSIISIMTPKARGKGLQLDYSIAPEVPTLIKGDPVRLNQVLTNLISNAIKFTEKGRVALTIKSNTSVNHDVLLEFTVSDTGIGIPEDKYDLIFGNFVQASDDTTRKYGGSGLGLAIVKSLVELQDGKISLTSQPQVGSSFQVQLPFEEITKKPQPASLNALKAAHKPSALKGAAVLVAEDNPVNQLLARKVLHRAGCVVDIAANGKEVITFLTSKRYDVVLMDIQMPEMDGYEATRTIRKTFAAPLSEIPIIAMTAHAFGSDVARCLTEGMNDYISKPFKAPDLYAKILKYLVKDTKVIPLNGLQEKPKVDLSAIHQISRRDPQFMRELVEVYNRQTPAFIEKLKSYRKDCNHDAIKSVCHQIKSSYGFFKMADLETALEEIAVILEEVNPDAAATKVSDCVDVIIALISVINEEVKSRLDGEDALYEICANAK